MQLVHTRNAVEGNVEYVAGMAVVKQHVSSALQNLGCLFRLTVTSSAVQMFAKSFHWPLHPKLVSENRNCTHVLQAGTDHKVNCELFLFIIRHDLR